MEVDPGFPAPSIQARSARGAGGGGAGLGIIVSMLTQRPWALGLLS